MFVLFGGFDCSIGQLECADGSWWFCVQVEVWGHTSCN